MKTFINGIFIGLGFLFIGLGMVGVALPLLPSTPFLILAAVCFAKGSKKFHSWFLSTSLYQKYVEPALSRKEMEKTTKRKTLITLCVIFIIGFWAVPVWHAKVVILLVAMFHIYYFAFKIKTVKTENKEMDSEVVNDKISP